MAWKINRLNAQAVGTITKYGRHADGGGLYLSISPNGGRRWVFLFRWHGKPTEIGFGSARDVTLARARELGAWARAKLAEGINPKDLKRPPQGTTFGECADRAIEAMRPSWRNDKHAKQWEMTLLNYAAPLRHLPVDKISTDDVLSVLKPLWNEKPKTASRLRGRVERVLDVAKAQGLRSGENPARWRGHLDQFLPKCQRLTRGHHWAMGYRGLPAFMGELQAQQATAALALEFAILTATRSGEVTGARWDEVDLDRAVWTIPAKRMKAGREHRVPLSGRALKIAKAMREGRDGEYVFHGRKPGKPLSGMALKMVLRRIKIDVTVHGFRSTFRDWAAARTNFPNEVCKAALAHVIEGKAEAADRHGDLFDERRKLMEGWASYCGALVEMGRIPLSEMSDTPPLALNTTVLAGRIDDILGDDRGVPNGKGNRTKLDSDQKQKLKSALIKAAECAHSLASKGPLPNRVPGAGRPPDNAYFVFINDLVCGCEGCGLKSGLRYVLGSQSLPVRVFIELAPLLWRRKTKYPRKLFERWQRLQADPRSQSGPLRLDGIRRTYLDPLSDLLLRLTK
jgi:integrase